MRINRSILALAAAVSLSVFGMSAPAMSATCNPPGSGTYAYGDPAGTGGTVSTDFVSGSESCAVGIIGGEVDKKEDASDIELLFGLNNVLSAGNWEWNKNTLQYVLEGGSNPEDVGFSVTGDTTSGDWKVTLDNFWTLYSELIIVQKDGGPDPGKWVAFDIASGVTSGMFWSIFGDGELGSVQDISHITAFVVQSSGNVGQVPLPAALPLLGGAIGIIGLVGLRRRRSA